MTRRLPPLCPPPAPAQRCPLIKRPHQPENPGSQHSSARPACPPSIIDALHNPVLFAGLLDDPPWRPWIAFLKALFGLPMHGADLALFQHHTGRQRAPSSPFREARLVVGRPGGKSRILALIATYLATVPD